MNQYTLNTSPKAPAIEQCCLTKLDKRFVIGIQIILVFISFNLVSAFHVSFTGLVFGTLVVLGFMIKEHVWAYAFAKLFALLFLVLYTVDVVSLIPLTSLPALSNGHMTPSLCLGELLGIWISAMLLTNLHPVPLRKLRPV